MTSARDAMYCWDTVRTREQTLRDLQRVEREVIRNNFFVTATGYLHERGLRHRGQVRGRGLSRDFFEAFANLDTPEIEEEVFLPEAVWVAHTLGRPIVSAEAFTFLSGHGRNLEREGQQRPHEGPLADPLACSGRRIRPCCAGMPARTLPAASIASRCTVSVTPHSACRRRDGASMPRSI